MEERTLELTIISAEDLKRVSPFGRDTRYAVAYIYSTEKRTTAVDKNGGANPHWNAKLTLTCDDKLLQRAGSYIIVEIYDYGSFSNKLVGTSKISLLDVGKHAGSSQPQFMAFEVRRPSGKAKGVLNVSVKVGGKRTVNVNNHSGQEAPLGYPQTYPPSSWRAQEPEVYPPPKAGYKAGVYPPQKDDSGSNFANGKAEYPPSKASGDPSVTGSSDSEKKEPVMAYPATGYPATYVPHQHGQQYGPQYYGSQYGGPQQYYPQQYYYGSPQSNDPYGYQNGQYSQPSRWQGSSSSGGGGLGLLGVILGGLLLGDVIANIF